MTRRAIAIAFLEAAASGAVDDAYARYVHPDFRHHNPHFPGSRSALMEGMRESAVHFPHKDFRVLRTLEDGDLVAVHGCITLAPGMPTFALVHILRFEGDKIIEEWEAAQQVPDDCPNDNGVF